MQGCTAPFLFLVLFLECCVGRVYLLDRAVFEGGYAEAAFGCSVIQKSEDSVDACESVGVGDGLTVEGWRAIGLDASAREDCGEGGGVIG